LYKYHRTYVSHESRKMSQYKNEIRNIFNLTKLLSVYKIEGKMEIMYKGL